MAKRGSAGPRATQQDMDRMFAKDSLLWIEWRVKNGEWISPGDLADALQAHPDEGLPAPVTDYLCRLLRGQVRKRPGPKTRWSASREILLEAARGTYQEELLRQKQLRKATGRSRGDVEPHAKAMAVVQKQFGIFRSISPRRLANILSSRNSRR